MAPAPQPTVTTHNDFGTVNVVETPTSPSSAFTLSRFEFETGTKGNEGTKILMIEWDAAAALSAENGSADGDDQDPKPTRASLDDWEVKWEGKEGITIPPIRDPETPASSCRIYFLLPPGAPIPTLVTISHRSSGAAPDTAPHTVPHTVPHPNPEEDHHHHHLDLHTKPLPAIFPDGLVSEDKGTRGVLHTIWAKQRLGELEAEILAEMKSNGESVGLEMALQERQWIVDHFGLQIDTSSAEAIPLAPSNLDSSSPASPRSPIGGRLGEKLKGLKLATSPSELAAAKEASQIQAKKFTAVVPDSAPAGFQPMSMATGSAAGMASLSAVMQGGPGVPERSGETEEDLFALPMSPRSPEMAMSPFSMLKS